MIPKEDLRYSKDHEWIGLEGDTAYIGITDYAQSELGDIVFIDIDSDLNEISVNEAFGSIEAVKTVSDLYAPVTGNVIEINDRLEDEPEIVNSDPFGEGWLIKVDLADTSQLSSLLSGKDYKNQIGG